jgi:hypothetical protein
LSLSRSTFVDTPSWSLHQWPLRSVAITRLAGDAPIHRRNHRNADASTVAKCAMASTPMAPARSLLCPNSRDPSAHAHASTPHPSRGSLSLCSSTPRVEESEHPCPVYTYDNDDGYPYM